MGRPKVNSVAIELTGHCNQKCSYCYNAWREDDGASLDGSDGERLLARVKKLIEQVDIDHVTLTGGEPFSKADIWPLLDLLSEAQIPAQIISNGGLITERIAKRLAPYAVGFVQVTLNGPNKALHEDHVGEGHYEPTLRGVRAMLTHGINVVGCVVVTGKNAPVLGETLELWHELGVRQVALSRFSPAGYAAAQVAELLPTSDDLMCAFEQAAAVARDRDMHLTCTMPVPPCMFDFEPYEPIEFGFCPIGTDMQEFALGPDGTLRNCTLHGRALGGVSDIASPDVDLAALLQHPDVTSYRREVPAFCEGCLHVDSCGGGCGAAADWVLGRDPDGKRLPDPVLWQHVDDTFDERLRGQRDGPRRLAVLP